MICLEVKGDCKSVSLPANPAALKMAQTFFSHLRTIEIKVKLTISLAITEPSQ